MFQANGATKPGEIPLKGYKMICTEHWSVYRKGRLFGFTIEFAK